MIDSDRRQKPVTAKLTPPHIDSAFLRPETLSIILRSLRSRLTLVCAPAGYGKTTALATSCEEASATVIWYRLDVLDHDALMFIGALTEAFARRFPGFGRPVVERLRFSHESPVSVDQLAAMFVSECAERLRTEVLVVFDDYHEAADSSDLNRALDRFLVDAPDNLRFVVLSRYEPAFSIGKIRLAGQVSIVGVDHLRFNESQAASVLEARGKRRFDAGQVERLVHLTEGWPASVVLAGLALEWLDLDSLEQALADPRMKQDIYSYLAEQVYRNEDESIKRFLGRTCCLEHITPDLANRMAEVTDGHTRLQHLAENRVFTFLTEPGTYRYHNLFREFLRHHYVYEHGEAAFRTLERQSAAALEASGDVEMAVELLFRANEPAAALEALSRAGEPGLDNFRTESLKGWLERLALEMRVDEPWARLLASQIHIRAGDFATAVADIDKAIVTFETSKDDWGLYQALSARESACFWMGNLEDQVETCERALTFASTDGQRFHTLLSLASAAVDRRDWAAAEAALAAADAFKACASPQERARGQALRALASFTQGCYWDAKANFPQYSSSQLSPVLTTGFLNVRGLIETGIGRYESASSLFMSAKQITDKFGLCIISLMIDDNLGLALAAQGNIEEGLQVIRRTLKEFTSEVDPILMSYAFMAEATILRRIGLPQDALFPYFQAHRLVSIERDPYVALDLAANHAFTQALLGHSIGNELVEISRRASASQLAFVALAADLYRAILLADRRSHDAEKILASCLPSQLRLGHLDVLAQELTPRPRIATLALEVLQSEDQIGLLESLALHWQYPELCQHLIEAKPALLPDALAAAVKQCSDRVLAEVIAVMRTVQSTFLSEGLDKALAQRPCAGSKHESPSSLPLTPREHEVLALMAEGLRNPQIASTLFLTNATVKTHVNHIFYKLGVTSRVEAVLRFKESEAEARGQSTSPNLNPSQTGNRAKV